MIREELEEALTELLGSGFVVDVDADGQVIVYTGLTEDEDGDLVKMDDDDEDGDPDLEDGDFEPYEEIDAED